MKIFKKLLVSLLFFTQISGYTTLFAENIRAAFDVGSGAIKMVVARVSEEPGQALKVLYSDQTEVLLAENFKQRKDGTLGDEILVKAEKVLLNYRDIAKKLGAEQFAGIATAIFRESKNGTNFIEKIVNKFDIDLRLISQEEEGRIGFLTAVAGSGKPADEVISWDSGGASFQIVTMSEKGIVVLEGPWGTSKVFASVIEDVRGQDFSQYRTPNPVTLDEVMATKKIIQNKFSLLHLALKEKIENPNVDVIGIGGHNSVFQIAVRAIGFNDNEFTKEQVWEALENLVGSTDEELSQYPQKQYVIPGLTLLYSVMDYFGISKVSYVPTNGSALGVLMTPQFWKSSKSNSQSLTPS